jgi:hypothetical protein
MRLVKHTNIHNWKKNINNDLRNIQVEGKGKQLVIFINVWWLKYKTIVALNCNASWNNMILFANLWE